MITGLNLLGEIMAELSRSLAPARPPRSSFCPAPLETQTCDSLSARKSNHLSGLDRARGPLLALKVEKAKFHICWPTGRPLEKCCG